MRNATVDKQMARGDNFNKRQRVFLYGRTSLRYSLSSKRPSPCLPLKEK